jgi:hypothetical protein
MNAQSIEYYRFKNGAWLTVFDLIYREHMVIPAKGTIMCFPGIANDFEVTKVAFNIRSATVEIEVAELYGTES